MEMIDYDGLAAEYARHRRLHPGVLQGILQAGGITATARVLEVGCGTGNYVVAIQSVTGCSCFGVDPSEEMLSRAKEQSDGVQWRIGTAEQLPYEQGTMDLVFSVDVIHHVSSLFDYYREAHRVLRPGGKLCTVTDSKWIIRHRLVSHYFPETVAAELQRYPAVGESLELMHRMGFADVCEDAVEHETQLSDVQAFRDKAFSCLRIIPDDAFERGMRRMEQDLQRGPIRMVSRYVLLWGTKADIA